MMNTTLLLNLPTIEGKELQAELGSPASIDSFFLLSLHKAGSTLLNQMMNAVCEKLHIPVFSPEEIEFQHGVNLGTLELQVQQHFKPRGYCFGGFRCYRPYLDGFDFAPFRKILLIRDPRDMLVSHYFSQKFSHALPVGELGEVLLERRESLNRQSVDEYAREHAAYVKSNFDLYEERVIDSNTRLFRYEDVIFEKRDWLQQMLQFLELDLPESDVNQIVLMNDILPTEEDPLVHIRKVTPGDHREKLQPTTIAYVNSVFGDLLERYDYQP